MSEATSIKRKKVTIPQLFQKKLKGEQITQLAVYDYANAREIGRAHV